MHLDGCFWGQILFWKHSCVAADSFLKHIFILEILTQILRFLLCCHVQGERIFMIFFKVSEYPFKPNKNVLKNMTVLLYTYFYNISLNVLRPTFFNIYNLPFLRSPNIGKIRVKVGPKTNYFSYFMSSCTNRIEVFNNFFSLICSQPRDKQNRARNFLLFKYFLNNLLLTVFMQNTLSKLVELLQ